MAAITRKLTGTLACLCLSIQAFASPSLDAPDPKALKAYKQFWDAFSDYEQRKKKAAVEEFERARDGLTSVYEVKDRDALKARMDLLSEGIGRYETHLTSQPTASNRPYVLLNLAQMLSELASLQHDVNPTEAGLNRQKALTMLKEAETRFPDFEYKNDAMYNRAILLESIQERDAALVVWRVLAQTQRSDRYALHANLAVGDWEFENANPENALKYYDKAQEHLSHIDPETRPVDALRIQYRIGWAAYKATRHDRAIAAAKQLLNPGVSAKAMRQREKIVRDAVDLVGFSLYELDDLGRTKTTVKSPDFAKHGAAIALSAMLRYTSAAQHERTALLGAFASDQFGAAAESPDLLVLTANANQALGRSLARIESLEKLAMLLPSNSLWRSKHSKDIGLTKSMEERATLAAVTSASFHYENGLASNTPRSFRHAGSFYDLLIQSQPNSSEAIQWRLKRANCLLYSGELKEANIQFSQIIEGLKVTDETLSIAMYQRAVTLEKIWRAALESATQKGIDATANPVAVQALINLEESVEDHANKFPGQSRSIDLLLVAASANRDHNRFTEASKFWQRSLLSSPTDVQRSMAVRGLVFAQLRAGKPAEIIEMVSKFLKLESSKTLSQNLTTELKGVLSSAAAEEAQSRAKLGQNEAGGDLLVEVAKEFKDIPNREQLYRDGAYMIAIGGNWPSAELAASQYLKEGNRKFWGDMTYLTARSAEFQMRFPQAVAAYLSLASMEPRHPRSAVSLERAEKLAVADENFKQAAESRLLAARNTTNTEQKLAALAEASEYQIKANNLEGALATASQRTRESKTDAARLESEALLAKVRYANGDKQTAIDDMDSIAKQVERNRLKLGDRYPAIAALVNQFLADDLRQKFSEFRLSDRRNLGEAVEAKSEIFASLSSRYDKVASLDQTEASPKARYLLATAANDFADELAGLPARSGEPLTLKSQNRFNQNITRLRDLAKRYHSNNILAKQRSPQLYAQSEWVRKSALILSSNGDDAVRDARDQTTSAAHMEVPQQWSF